MINFILFIIILIFALAIIMQVSHLNDVGKSIDGNALEYKEKGYSKSAIMLVGFALILLAFIYYTHYAFKPHLLPVSASEHGTEIDRLFDITGYLTGFVFIVTQFLLFFFVFKYKGKKDRKGYFYPLNHKLEIWWTVIPSLFLVFLVFSGMKAWYKITTPASKDSQVIEVTGEQFKWTVRYPGADNILGMKRFELLGKDDGKNILGVDWESPGAKDDFLADEIHILVNKMVDFHLGSKDVIHSFFLPHFRVQQNCVPGMPTLFHFIPTITTAEMRQKTGNPSFDYWLACAAICGSSHYNMKMKVVVDDEASYKAWFDQQKGNSYYTTVINPAAAATVTDTITKLGNKDTTLVVVSKKAEVKDTLKSK